MPFCPPLHQNYMNLKYGLRSPPQTRLLQFVLTESSKDVEGRAVKLVKPVIPPVLTRGTDVVLFSGTRRPRGSPVTNLKTHSFFIFTGTISRYILLDDSMLMN